MTTAFENKYRGGLCYASCNELYSFYNSALTTCRKGCDFAMGRMGTEHGREEARNMCKQFTSELFVVPAGMLEEIKDLRVTPDTFANTAENVYKVCLTGVRRQEF